MGDRLYGALVEMNEDADAAVTDRNVCVTSENPGTNESEPGSPNARFDALESLTIK